MSPMMGHGDSRRSVRGNGFPVEPSMAASSVVTRGTAVTGSARQGVR